MPTNFATIDFAPHPRHQIRQHILGMRAKNNSPMPDAAVEEIVDIALHAAESGRRAMLEVIDRASDTRVSISAISIAASLLGHDMKTLIGGLEDAAKKVGLHFESATLGAQAHG